MIVITNEDNMLLMARYPDKYFDLAIVDPPYGLGSSVVNSGGRFARYKNDKGNWDNETPTKQYFEELFRVSKNQIIWGGNYFDLLPTKCFLIWDKKQPENVSFASCEFAWTSFDSVAKTFYYRPQGQENRFHPTQKPVALYKWILDKYAKQGDKILDTHLGSGSIAIACHDYGFDLTACELDKEYFEAAMKRLKDHQKQLKLIIK
jgi:site-specific DNA-methyltransferase (adenine-specific)